MWGWNLGEFAKLPVGRGTLDPSTSPSTSSGQAQDRLRAGLILSLKGEGDKRGLVVVEVIRFVWLPFFLWWDTKGVFIADWGEIRHSLYCCSKNEWGLLPEGGLGLVEPPVKLRNWYVCFMAEMVSGVGGLWQGGGGSFGGGSPH